MSLGSNGRLLADYITRISDHLHKKGRTPIVWIEYPLKSNDINHLPPDIIDGEYNPKWAAQIKQRGIRQLIYTSTQGVEPLFPNYYTLPKKVLSSQTQPLNDDELQQGDISDGRVNGLIKGISSAMNNGNADFMGVIVAGWADAGLNPETFWLGYATGCAAAWNLQSKNATDLSERFYHSFYGPRAIEMNRIYGLLSTQAEFWDNSWEWKPSVFRKGIFGNSSTVYDTARSAKDQFLPALPIPSGNLELNTDWNKINAERISMARKFLKQNDSLMSLLALNFEQTVFNHYNLEVLRTVAVLCRQNLQMLLGMKKINDLLNLSSKLASSNPVASIELMDQALDESKNIKRQRNDAYGEICSVWYRNWYPRVTEANGRKYLDEVDDVKDHPPVRTVDMSYLIYRQLNYPMEGWAKALTNVRNAFANKNNLPAKSFNLNWQQYK